MKVVSQLKLKSGKRVLSVRESQGKVREIENFGL